MLSCQSKSDLIRLSNFAEAILDARYRMLDNKKFSGEEEYIEYPKTSVQNH